MAISSVSSPNPLDQLAQSLVARFDANKDGQLTTDEFTSFLSSFLTSAGMLVFGDRFGADGSTRVFTSTRRQDPAVVSSCRPPALPRRRTASASR